MIPTHVFFLVLLQGNGSKLEVNGENKNGRGVEGESRRLPYELLYKLLSYLDG